ncbi:NAD-dependent epimerase/dehydratase family protein [Blastomonas sp.]|uniref:NAD-dependent epimerase/dehydratase family protein n=1 Tax=Blastomonas sp. TaxID=1909299 RepID=UPI00391D5827
MSVIAMTGGTGFVGGASITEALANGHQVRALTRRPQPQRDGVTWVAGALDDADSLATLCTGADCVLHIAGVVNAPDRAGFVAGNITGTENMLAAAKSADVARFIHVSSLAAREPDLSNYCWSKAQAEARVVSSGLNWQMVRPPAVYGPGDTEMLDLFRMAARGVVMLPPGGRMSVVHVADLAALLVRLAGGAGDTGAIYEVDDGSPRGWSHKDFADALGDAVGRKVRAISTPKLALHLAAQGDRLLRGKAAKLTPDRARYIAHSDWTSDPEKRPPSQLWQPDIATRQGLADTARWYRAKGWLK